MQRHHRSAMFGAKCFAVLLLLVNQFGAPLAMAAGGGGGPQSPFDSNADGIIDGADLAPVLGNWGDGAGVGDFNGNCSVGSEDLGLLLAAWGEVQPPSPGRVSWKNRTVSLCLGPALGSIEAVVTGQYTPAGGPGGPGGDPSCVGYGDFTVTLDGVASNQISISPNGIIGFGFDCKISFDPSQEDGDIGVDGIDTTIDAVLEGMADDFESAGSNVAGWDCYTLMMMSVLVVFGDPEMKANQPDDCEGPGFWCKAFATAAGAVVVGLGTAGCTALTAGCTAGTPLTLGGITLPCVAWIAICAGLVAGGYQAAYDVALSWCD